jgi:hypothetical protein
MVRCVLFTLLTICLAHDADYISAETDKMGVAEEVAVDLLQLKGSISEDTEGDDDFTADIDAMAALDSDDDFDSVESDVSENAEDNEVADVAVDTDNDEDSDVDQDAMADFDSDENLNFVESDISEEKCDAFDKANPDLVKVDFSLAENSISNLGGVGPQTGVAEQLYYKRAATAIGNGDAYDLKVTVRGNAYHAKTPNINGQNGHYGVINVACGTSVDLDFQFVDPKTGQAATLDHLFFSWFDLDKGKFGGGEEEVTLWPGYSNTLVSSFSEIVQSEGSCPAGAGAQKCKRFLSSKWGVGKDNPTNPLTLTKQQAARTFSVEYKKVSSFSVTLRAGEGFGSRNFLFTGMSQVAYSTVDECCPAHICGCQDFCAEKNDATWEEKCKIAKCSTCDQCVDTTTTTTAAPATKEEACKNGLTFELSSDSLVENTLGKKKKGRMLFKGVLEYEGRSVDLSVTDVAKDPKYNNLGRRKYKADRRGYTGEYKGAGRVAFDKPGLYVLRFMMLDSKTGKETKLPLLPFVMYDVDGKGESITACGSAGAITHDDTSLTERESQGCFYHTSTKKEANIPTDFDSLTPNQKKVSVTYMYRNTGSWDIGVTLNNDEKERYILFGSSKVLACNYADQTRDEPWKNKGKTGDA